jgi:hypothetical protein
MRCGFWGQMPIIVVLVIIVLEVFSIHYIKKFKGLKLKQNDE